MLPQGLIIIKTGVDSLSFTLEYINKSFSVDPNDKKVIIIIKIREFVLNYWIQQSLLKLVIPPKEL